MKKKYCIICGKYKKFKNLKITQFFGKILVFPIICNLCENENEKVFKEEELLQILAFLRNKQLL